LAVPGPLAALRLRTLLVPGTGVLRDIAGHFFLLLPGDAKDLR
jgi:hypothetical protein